MLVLLLLLGACAVPWSSGAAGAQEVAADPPNGVTTFFPVTPCRLLDTRTSGGPIQPGKARLVRVSEAGACHVPEQALAVEVTVTAVKPQGDGFLRAYAQGFSPPTATFLNYAQGEDASNTGSIWISPSPPPATALALRTWGSATDVVIDVQGYFVQAGATPAGNVFTATKPCRAYDSRTAAAGTPFAAGERRDLPLVGLAGCDVPAGAVAVETTITAVDSPGSGFLRAWPAGQPMPNATFLTHVGGRSTSNTGTVSIRSGTGHPNLSVRNFGTATHVVVEVQGWYVPAPAPPAGWYRPRPLACRVFDTRTSGGPMAPGASRGVKITNVPGCNIPDDAVAVEASITAIDPAGSGFLRAWPAGKSMANATFLTFAADRSTTNTGTVEIRPGAEVPNLLLRNFGSAADYVVDIQGWYIPTE